jgi:hypothetical protein
MGLPEMLQGRYRPNILFVGAERAAEAALDRLGPLLGGPVKTCLLPGPLCLPGIEFAALVLRNVEALRPEQQSELLDWMNTPARVPILSVTSASLFAQVQKGEFSEQLYYRLNTILEEVDDSVSEPV